PNAPGGGDPRDLKHFPQMTETLAPAERTTRSRMRDLANGYFSTLQLNDGKIFTVFDPACSRIDNGTVTVGDPNSPNPRYRGTCEDEFKNGRYKFDNALRERDFPLIDEEKGVILTRAFLDHSAVVVDFKLNDGTSISSSFKT